MLRETTFRVGGALMIGLGLLLGVGLFLAAAGWEFFDAWLGAGICVGFGGFFLYVARDEARTRRAFLASHGDPESPPPPASPP
jgi:hypothetical protein